MIAKTDIAQVSSFLSFLCQLIFSSWYRKNIYTCLCFWWCSENCPPVRVRVWFRISVRIRAGGQFSSGVIFLEPFYLYTKIEILRCQNLSDVQITYSDIGKIKYQNTENTKCGISGIWYFLCMLLIISVLYFSTSRPAWVQKSFVRPTDHSHQLFT